MDRFTRNYSIGLAVIVLAVAVYWGYSLWTPRVWEINAVLEADQKLAGYPYAFRVRALRDGVATLSTPRSVEFPAIRLLVLLDPSLNGLAQDDPRMIAAQEHLIAHQKHALALVQGQPDVRTVRWELDRAWLAARGVAVSRQ